MNDQIKLSLMRQRMERTKLRIRVLQLRIEAKRKGVYIEDILERYKTP